MNDPLRRVQGRARALAQSGKFASWRSIAFELGFEPGYQEAFEWLFNPSTRDELECLCRSARKGLTRKDDPEAA